MVISGDGKLAVSEEAACENVGQLRLLSNNSASVNCPASVSRGGVGPGRRIGGSRESLKGDIGCPALGKELAGLGHLRVQCSSLERPSQLSSVAPLPSCVYTRDRRSLLQCRPPHTCACSLCLLEMGTQQRLGHIQAPPLQPASANEPHYGKAPSGSIPRPPNHTIIESDHCFPN